MADIYLNKVRNILGGFIDENEVKIVNDCFSKLLSPEKAAQVVLNNR